MQCCSLHHWTLLSPPDPSTAVCYSHCGPATPFFLELLVIAFCSSPVAYWTPSNLRGLIFWCCIFLPFHTVHGVLSARILEWFAILSSRGPFLSKLFTMTHLSWLAMQGMTHSFIELCKLLCYDKTSQVAQW